MSAGGNPSRPSRRDAEHVPAGLDQPSVSVVLAADHDTASHAELTDLRRCLEALAAQRVDEPVEFLLAETPERARKLPDELIRALPNLRVV
ncbi:MAG TPA: hypothetical protein VNB06_18690 [Thermoanaerobaculia bacterium]|nr:hypothetical protein [Thermoanaerobaculia bacterium]